MTLPEFTKKYADVLHGQMQDDLHDLLIPEISDGAGVEVKARAEEYLKVNIGMAGAIAHMAFNNNDVSPSVLGLPGMEKLMANLHRLAFIHGAVSVLYDMRKKAERVA